MSVKAKKQTREDIYKRLEQIKEYRSHFNSTYYDPNNVRDVDVFNEEVMDDENCVNFLIDLANILVKYDVGVNTVNGYWSSFTFNNKHIGIGVVSKFVMESNESMEECLEEMREYYKKGK